MTNPRWDRERFERFQRPEERDYLRYEERETPRRSNVLLDERLERRGPRSQLDERERFVEEERYEAPRRRRDMGFLDERPRPEMTGQALAPYRRPRPQFIRRQSSLDTFDRRPMGRPSDDYRLPAEVPIPLPIRRPRNPPREQFHEEYERYHDSDEDYQDFRVQQERKGRHRSQSRMRSRSVRRRRSRSSSSSAASSFEEIIVGEEIGRKGRTKMPKRLVHKSAVVEKGLPFEEDGEFIIVQRALDKVHIDEIIEISKKHREDQAVSYKFEEVIKGPVEKKSVRREKSEEFKETERDTKREEINIQEIRPDGTQFFENIERSERKTDTVVENPPLHHYQPELQAVQGGELVRRTTTTKVIDPPDHHHHHQDLIVPDNHRRQSESELRREIRALEAERASLQLERRSERISVRSIRSRPPPKLVGLALATLT